MWTVVIPVRYETHKKSISPEQELKIAKTNHSDCIFTLDEFEVDKMNTCDLTVNVHCNS